MKMTLPYYAPTWPDFVAFVRRDLDCAVRIMTVVCRKDHCSNKMFNEAVENYQRAAVAASMVRNAR